MPFRDEIADSEDEPLTSSPLEHVYEHRESAAAMVAATADVLGELVDASCQAANVDFAHEPSPSHACETFKGAQTGASDDAELPNTAHQTDTQPNTSISASHIDKAADLADVIDKPAVHVKRQVLPATAILNGGSNGEQELQTIDEAEMNQDMAVTSEPQKQDMTIMNEPEKRRELEQTDAIEEPEEERDVEIVEEHEQDQGIPAADQYVTESLESGVQNAEMRKFDIVGNKPAKPKDDHVLDAAQEPILNIVSKPPERELQGNLVLATSLEGQDADAQQESASSLKPPVAGTSMESKLSSMAMDSTLQTELQPSTAETEADAQQPTPATTGSSTAKRPLSEEPGMSVDMAKIPHNPTPPTTRPKTAQEITIAELQAQKSALIASLAALENVQELVAEDESSDLMCTFGITEPSESDIMTAADKIVKRHIKLLHEYNEIKDVAQGLMGLIADSRGVRIVEVQEEFGVNSND